LGHGVEEPDLREFDGEVAEEHEHRTVPLLFRRWDFLLCHRLACGCPMNTPRLCNIRTF
jgi:hypothetical protein